MKNRRLQLTLLKEMFGICRYENTAPIPDWASDAPMCSITRTKKELTIVCPQNIIPAESDCSGQWRCFRIDGSFELDETGVIASVSVPLAEAGISIYVVSTYDTDYFLIRDCAIENAIAVLTDMGHKITQET
jgi:hypothetical protein